MISFMSDGEGRVALLLEMSESRTYWQLMRSAGTPAAEAALPENAGVLGELGFHSAPAVASLAAQRPTPSCLGNESQHLKVATSVCMSWGRGEVRTSQAPTSADKKVCFAHRSCHFSAH